MEYNATSAATAPRAAWWEQIFKPAWRPPAVSPFGLAVLVAFAAAYAGGQSFVYVEGDDASTIAYHALGRNPAIQPPYSSYNGMMDFILGFLPGHEGVVRVAALLISSLGAVAFVLLSLQLAFAWLGRKLTASHQVWITILALLALPELFFFGLVYTPNVVAMSFILAGHLLLRHAWEAHRLAEQVTRRGLLTFALSLALYGFGVSCRWETAAYGLVVVVDMWLGMPGPTGPGRWPRRLLAGFVWGGLALVAAFAWIRVSGYGLYDLAIWVEMSRQASAGHFDTGFTLFTFVGRHQTFFTPATVLLAVVGLFGFCCLGRAQLVRALIGFLPVIPLFYRGAPKLLLSAVPGLLLCMAYGLIILVFPSRSTRFTSITRAVVLAAAILPWLVGVRIHSSDTQWGPGFNVRTPAPAVAVAGDFPTRDADRTIGISKMKLAWADGFAVATPEGPRPVGAFGAVLFGGGWRSLVNSLEDERHRVITEAAAGPMPILQDDGNALIVVHMLGMGYSTDRNRKDFVQGFNRRVFVNKQAEQLTVVQLQERPSLFNIPQLDALLADLGQSQVILYSSYSSSMKRLFQVAPEAATALGPFSARLDLVKLRAVMESRKKG